MFIVIRLCNVYNAARWSRHISPHGLIVMGARESNSACRCLCNSMKAMVSMEHEMTRGRQWNGMVKREGRVERGVQRTQISDRLD